MKDYTKLYINFLENNFSLKKKIKIIIDSSNGITGEILKKIKNPNLEMIFINSSPNGNFPAHGPNPLTAGSLNDIKKAILKEKADLGATFDGDGDRIIFCDNLGHEIQTDIVMRLLMSYLKPKKIILDPRNGYLIKNLAIQKNIETIEAKVGRYFIQKSMNEENADLAVETAGHYHFHFKIKNEFYHFDDAAIAMVKVINALSNLPYKFSDFIELLPKYYRLKETNFSIRNKENALRKIENFFSAKAKRISKLDGLTMEFSDKNGNWWFNIRPSANDPVIRLNVESSNKQLLDKSLRELKNIILQLQ